MPYDQLVAATLLAIKHHLGNDVQINADGDHRSGAWCAVVNLYLRTFLDRDVQPSKTGSAPKADGSEQLSAAPARRRRG